MAIPPSLSVIIPCYNEAKSIAALVNHLAANSDDEVEILVVDGGSTDGTCTCIDTRKAKIIHSAKGRAQQMNAGAKEAIGDILYFVHADTLPPSSFQKDIYDAIQQGYSYGGYRFKFDPTRPILRLNEYLTRFPWAWTRGGDQTLYIEKSLFDEVGGYDEKYVIMEEYDLMRKVRRKGNKMRVLPKEVIGSARKYTYNSYARVTLANFIIFQAYKFGVNPTQLLHWYYRLLRHPKAPN